MTIAWFTILKIRGSIVLTREGKGVSGRSPVPCSSFHTLKCGETECGASPTPQSVGFVSHWQCERRAGAPRSLGVLSTFGMWGTMWGAAPRPSLTHFFFSKRNGSEPQRKSFSLAVAVVLVVLFGSTGIVSSRAVEERLGASTPLSRFWLCSHSFAPSCVLGSQ